MIQLVRIAPFFLKIQIRKLYNFFIKRKIQITLISIVLLIILFSGKLRLISVSFSNNLLFIFLLISFIPLFQKIPEIIFNPNLMILKIINLNSLKILYIYKTIIKPLILIFVTYIVVPFFISVNMNTLIIILLIRTSIACYTFLKFQTKRNNFHIIICIFFYFFAYSMQNAYIILLFISIQSIYFLLLKQLSYEILICIYKSIFRLKQGFQSDLDGFIKAQEVISNKTYIKHFNFMEKYYNNKMYYVLFQLSRIFADYTYYIPQYVFVILLTIGYKIFNFDKHIILITIFFIIFTVISQIINPIYSKIAQGLYLKLDNSLLLNIFVIPCFIISVPFIFSLGIITQRFFPIALIHILCSLSFFSKNKIRLVKFIYWFSVIADICFLFIA